MKNSNLNELHTVKYYLIAILIVISIRAQCYSPDDAAAYADTWTCEYGNYGCDDQMHNPAYNYYYGDDCANFVSQCLIAGGLDLSSGPGVDAWGCIPFCDNVHTHLTTYQNVEYERIYSGYPSWFEMGDVVMFGDNYTDYWEHSCIAVTSNAPLLDAHTTNRYHKSVSFYYGSFVNGDFYHFYPPIVNPPNDACVDAINLTVNSSCITTNGTVLGANGDGFPTDPSCDNVSDDPNGVFYTFTAINSPTHTITVTPASGNTILDPVIVVYSGISCFNLTEVSGGCMDNNSYGEAETLNINGLVSGTTYWIRVYDYGSVEPPDGAFTICVWATPCTYSINPTSWNYPAGGDSKSVSLTTQNNCSWTASVPGACSSWLTVTPMSGTGSGNVTVTATSNPGPGTRSCTVTIAGQSYSVTQDAPSCTYSIYPTTWNYPSAGDSKTVSISTNFSTCSWTASVPGACSSWLSVTPTSGTGSSNVTVTAQQNSGANSRNCTVTIAGQSFDVTQDGTVPCTYSILPSSFPFPSGGGSTPIAITTNPQTCSWTSDLSLCAWLHAVPTSGTGNANVSLTADPNPNINDRQCTITIATQPFNVTQSGIGGGQCNPDAEFGSSQNPVHVGEPVDYIDLSTVNPGCTIDSHTWTFYNANPGSSTSTDPMGIVYNAVGNYSVRLEITSGGETSQKFVQNYMTVLPLVGIDEINREFSMTILPNPSNGLFEVSISSSQKIDEASIVIYNSLGQRVSESEWKVDQKSFTKHFSISKATTGVYQMKVEINGEYLATKKILIE